MTRADHIHALLEEYARKRLENDRALAARVDRATALDPEIARLRAARADVAMNAMRSILGAESQERRVEIAETMQKEGLRLNSEIRSRLVAVGMPENALELQYHCDLCKDTGYVGEAPARFCSCFEDALRARFHADQALEGLKGQTFDNFNEYLIPEEGNQRRNTLIVRDHCKRYAELYPDFKPRNLLLMGTPGLGKTFLLNCTFERIIERGYSAVRITAYRLFEAMRAYAFGKDTETFDSLTAAPILFIDDLGTEPLVQNITREMLFLLLNERYAAGRHTAIATNLNVNELSERYGERVKSRLLNRDCTTGFMLTGRDLRTIDTSR
ncbi:MAG: ATP-binding protein [Clostridia bacterium]|nr:ATP-binding protein [Clostridia bacterium]